LYVGNVKPHKNVATLVRAFAALAPQIPHHLAIVGRIDGMRTSDDEVRRLAADVGPRVHLVGEVSDDELAAWIGHATAFAFPSLYEGFGLPPLEAMAAGCPCLVARSGSLPEVCGDAAHYCDPHDVSDVAARLHELLTDEALRVRLRTRGLERAAAYPWERCVAGTVAVIEETLAT
jgi:glycosyltransferase involved in cell wall biosynthesis